MRYHAETDGLRLVYWSFDKTPVFFLPSQTVDGQFFGVGVMLGRGLFLFLPLWTLGGQFLSVRHCGGRIN